MRLWNTKKPALAHPSILGLFREAGHSALVRDGQHAEPGRRLHGRDGRQAAVSPMEIYERPKSTSDKPSP